MAERMPSRDLVLGMSHSVPAVMDGMTACCTRVFFCFLVYIVLAILLVLVVAPLVLLVLCVVVLARRTEMS